MDRRFRILISGIKQLFNQFAEERGPINLGEVWLPHPLRKITFFGHALVNHFSLLATIFPAAAPKPDDLTGESHLIKPPHDYLKSLYKTTEVVDAKADSVCVFDREGDIECVIAYSFVEGWLTIEMGSSGAKAKPISKDYKAIIGFKNDITKFAEVVTTVVNGLYMRAGQPIPNVDFTIKPPELGDSESFFGGRQETETDEAEIKKAEPISLSFEDLGGQPQLKEEIMAIGKSFANPGVYKKWGSSFPKGYLLAGPPGTGKTLAAKILASTIAANFFDVNLAEIVSMWYGQSDRNMNDLFDAACKKKPSIIFFDEIDALAITRGSESHEASVRMLSIMLKRMSDLKPEDRVLIICATNRAEAVDPAFLRPGRIDKIIKVDLPNEGGIKEIFGIHRQKAEKIAGREIFRVDWDLVAKSSEGMSGAEIAEIIRRALEVKVRQELKGEESSAYVLTEDVIKQINTYERRGSKRKIGFAV